MNYLEAIQLNPDGVFTLRNGERAYSVAIDHMDGTFSLRYEPGWYALHEADGTLKAAGSVLCQDGSQEDRPPSNGRDVVSFEPMSWEEAQAKSPGIGYGFHP